MDAEGVLTSVLVFHCPSLRARSGESLTWLGGGDHRQVIPFQPQAADIREPISGHGVQLQILPRVVAATQQGRQCARGCTRAPVGSVLPTAPWSSALLPTHQYDQIWMWVLLLLSVRAQSHPTVYGPSYLADSSLPGFSVHGVLQARILE